ncbi:MAG: glycosyltransferase family 39 protein [Actinomycetota bacterium]|nr:glycosyltransferase family 39 protein [Actinomycetota bacterium]
MATHAVRGRAVPRLGALASSRLAVLAILAFLLALSTLIRTRALAAGFWIDEGVTVGISSFPFTEIPTVLRQDGSPPLYYLLLHLWMQIAGTGEADTHALSLLFALASIPAALWATSSLFGRRAGWVAALLAALHPFITVYAQETRMYSLVILLSILATAAFAHAFVFRRRRYVPVFALLLALMLYTHNWALFFTLGALAALALCVRSADDRRGLLTDGALAFGAALLAFTPWVPTLLYQAFHTGAPWSNPPSPLELIGAVVAVMSGQGSLVALVLAAAVGLAERVRGPASRERTLVLAILVLAVTTLLAAWLYSQVSPAWANRYLGVLVGPVLILSAAGVPRAGRLGIVALALVALFWGGFLADNSKANIREVAARFEKRVGPDDVILSTQPEQVPVLTYYFGRDHRYATPLGPVREPRVMDWRDALPRLETTSVRKALVPLLDGLPAGSHVFLVRPLIREKRQWSAEWTALVRARTRQWTRALARDERFTRIASAAPPYTEHVPRGVRVDVYTKAVDG